MRRRSFVRTALGLLGGLVAVPRFFQAKAQSADTITIYDTYAMALYMDGTLGPKTGIVRAEAMIAGEPLVYQFWHGHGGVSHRFTIASEDFALLRTGTRVTITTSVVDRHQHRLFIDPIDARYRLPGAEPIEVPLPELIAE